MACAAPAAPCQLSSRLTQSANQQRRPPGPARLQQDHAAAADLPWRWRLGQGPGDTARRRVLPVVSSLPGAAARHFAVASPHRPPLKPGRAALCRPARAGRRAGADTSTPSAARTRAPACGPSLPRSRLHTPPQHRGLPAHPGGHQRQGPRRAPRAVRRGRQPHPGIRCGPRALLAPMPLVFPPPAAAAATLPCPNNAVPRQRPCRWPAHAPRPPSPQAPARLPTAAPCHAARPPP
jgi:hypothetical protein